MSPGAHLSLAARLAFDAQRAHLASLLHLESAGYDIDEEVADITAALAARSADLQAFADEYGHAEVRRLAKASEKSAEGRAA